MASNIPIYYKKIWSINGTPIGTTTSGHSGTWSNDNEGVVLSPQISDDLVSYVGQVLLGVGFILLQGIQSVYYKPCRQGGFRLVFCFLLNFVLGFFLFCCFCQGCQSENKKKNSLITSWKDLMNPKSNKDKKKTGKENKNENYKLFDYLGV